MALAFIGGGVNEKATKRLFHASGNCDQRRKEIDS
jgi:hypothetical protein